MAKTDFDNWYKKSVLRPVEIRRANIDRFLHSCSITVRHRGNNDEKLVVLTIQNRFKNSKWATVPKTELWRCWCICNHKYKKYVTTTKRLIGTKSTKRQKNK